MRRVLQTVATAPAGLLGAWLGYDVGGIGGAVLFAIILGLGGALAGSLVWRTGRLIGWRIASAVTGAAILTLVTWGVYL